MERKACKLCVDIVATPKPEQDARGATANMRMPSPIGGSPTTPTAPQMTDVAPNRCGEPMNPLKGALAL
jgi:hypothetical protein